MPRLNRQTNSEYVELFNKLPPRIQQRIRKGKLRCSYTGLRRYNMLIRVYRKRVRAVWNECGCLDEALRTVDRISGAERLAARQRQLIAEGLIPEHVHYSTPPMSSGDLESFFIPSPYATWRTFDDSTPVIEPIGMKEKRFGK